MAEVHIIGAGISGLSCAWTLKKLGIDAVIIEESSRAGGVIRTEKIDGYQVECGPNSLQSAPGALRLVDEVGLWDDILTPAPNAPRFVYWDGKLRKIPFGPFSAGGMLRILREPFVRSKYTADESVRDFFIRRVGRQAHDRLIGPALIGIYAADTSKLSMAAVFPKILEMERDAGSLTRAFVRSLRGKKKDAKAAAVSSRPKPKGSIFSFPEGIETLTRAVAGQVNIQYEVNDAKIGDAPVTVVSVPSYRAAEVFAPRNASLAETLKKVTYAPMVIAAVSLPDHALKQPLQGFGFLVAREQGLHMLGGIFSSALFPDRAPIDRHLVTCFAGGMFEPEAIDWTDSRVWETVCAELKTALQASEMPEPVALFRQRHAIPQYNIGHERWAASVKEELKKMPGVFVASNYLDGVSVPACIDQGDRTAHAVAEYLGRR